ncbi:SIR2 family protein [Rhodomicrobium udaipurense]|uniref:SIR2 family protein n=1 Tax=Rhodomicrobium udaipurense TaxID=1202716 RepID=A0A8I1KL04_9HYPH|nr:SIR2 family protein [Rhodomicrobium udaipurense]MBJ7544749.1 SIR2 family protein [Rhodomicrobium udaipurense]
MEAKKHLLLLGAGFSRNWGGWLASEVFEYLLGIPEISDCPKLRSLLWSTKLKGRGFEGALADMQAQYACLQDAESKKLLDKLQSAVAKMFQDMNDGLERRTFEFSNSSASSVCEFLARFDAIFTLNQDVLLETHYDFVQCPPPHRWSGRVFPGMVATHLGGQLPLSRKSWIPSGEHKVPRGSQPIFKLHGSTNWQAPDSSNMLIIGGNKSPTIQALPLLRWYSQQFAEYLRSPNARLMVIGYGFRDQHINEYLQAAKSSGLRLFIIDPEGSDVVERIKWASGAIGAPGHPTDLEEMINGGSRRSLREIFGGDDVELAKVKRFFDS